MGLNDLIIYSFTDKLLELGNMINKSYGNLSINYAFENSSVEAVKELAEIFKTSKNLDIYAIRRMQKTHDFDSFNTVQITVQNLIEKLGY